MGKFGKSEVLFKSLGFVCKHFFLIPFTSSHCLLSSTFAYSTKKPKTLLTCSNAQKTLWKSLLCRLVYTCKTIPDPPDLPVAIIGRILRASKFLEEGGYFWHFMGKTSLQSYRYQFNLLSLFAVVKQVTNEGGTDDSYSYYVNLCRPLVPMPGKNCPAAAWACRIKGRRIQVAVDMLLW